MCAKFVSSFCPDFDGEEIIPHRFETNPSKPRFSNEEPSEPHGFNPGMKLVKRAVNERKKINHHKLGTVPSKPRSFNYDVQLSKALTPPSGQRVLDAKFEVHSGGNAGLSAALRHSSNPFTEEDIKRIVPQNEWGSIPSQCQAVLAAKQGRTYAIEGLPIRMNRFAVLKMWPRRTSMRRVTPESCVRVALAGAKLGDWKRIQNDGLSRKDEDYIRMTRPGVTVTFEGSEPAVLVYVDVQRAMLQDIEFFFENEMNDVVLSKGNDKGIIPAKCLLKIVDTKSGTPLWPKLQ